MYTPTLRMFLFAASIFMLCAGNVLGCDNINNMVTFDARSPDGSVDSDTTEALLKEWSLACQSNVGGTVTVPPGTFLVNTVEFKGPCYGPITFNVDGNLEAPSDPSAGEDHWILFDSVDGLTISGNGSFDGQGTTVWNNCKEGSCSDRPAGIKSINSKFFHFHIHGCENFNINGVSITAPGDSPNTDGIHISNSNNVQISQVSIATGDDCISLGPGTTNINISHVLCGPGHGISIGSLGKSSGETPVQGVTVSDSTLTGTTNGLRIKTFSPSPPNTVSNITFQNISVNNIENPILIDQNYCLQDSCGDKSNSQVQISNVKFINIHGTSASEVSVSLNCSESVPCQGIVLQDLKLTFKSSQVPSKAACSKFHGTFNGNQVPPTCMNNS